MPSIRTYRSILHSVNNTTVAVSSSATASRIPAPLPTAAVCCIPRPVNSLSVVRKHTPTVQRARPTTRIASLTSSFATTVISKPVNQAIAPSSAPKPASSLPCVAAPCSKLASDRFQARRQKFIANLQRTKKRPAVPELNRAIPPVPKILVSILKTKLHEGMLVKKKPRVIPPPSANAPPSTVVSSWTGSTSLNLRGNRPYCESRPCTLDHNDNHPRIDYAGFSFFSISCTYHSAGGMIPTRHWVRPHEWETTPAEADVDPTRPRVVRFADNPVQSTMPVSRWWATVWPRCEKSKHVATEADDDAAIHAMDNPPPVRSDFRNTCDALMDQYFPDEDE